ncbi:hypothetical protein LIER_10853 [Lithospermum erythrorhizon]|uniref:Uncharacterized protein n=1 Tax=Lithospermum erythrorhizon TaxID=34254 RepID=A0AAV3PL51_LITER
MGEFLCHYDVIPRSSTVNKPVLKRGDDGVHVWKIIRTREFVVRHLKDDGFYFITREMAIQIGNLGRGHGVGNVGEGFKLNLRSGAIGGIEKIGKIAFTVITNFAVFSNKSARDISKFMDIVGPGLMSNM